MPTEQYINDTHYYVLLSHVIAGFLCLISGIIAIVANPKGGKLHRKSGIVYFWCMVIIFVTSLIAIAFFKFKFFLLMISIFSFFLSFTGYRSLKRKKPNDVKWYDKLVAFAGLLTGFSLIGYGVYAIIKHGNYGFSSICFVFGFLLSANSYKDIKHFRKTEYEKLWWWFHHLNMMMASFIAAFTAFLVNNYYKLTGDLGNWNFIFWLLPTFVLAPLISKWNRHYKRKFKIN